MSDANVHSTRAFTQVTAVLLETAARAALVLMQMRAERLRQAAVTSELVARRERARLSAQRGADVASWRRTGDPAFWRSATSADISQIWRATSAWHHVDAEAAGIRHAIAEKLRHRGINLVADPAADPGDVRWLQTALHLAQAENDDWSPWAGSGAPSLAEAPEKVLWDKDEPPQVQLPRERRQRRVVVTRPSVTKPPSKAPNSRSTTTSPASASPVAASTAATPPPRLSDAGRPAKSGANGVTAESAKARIESSLDNRTPTTFTTQPRTAPAAVAADKVLWDKHEPPSAATSRSARPYQTTSTPNGNSRSAHATRAETPATDKRSTPAPIRTSRYTSATTPAANTKASRVGSTAASDPNRRQSTPVKVVLAGPRPSPLDNSQAEQLLRNAWPDRAERILADPAWPMLANKISSLHQAGKDVPALLGRVPFDTSQAQLPAVLTSWALNAASRGQHALHRAAAQRTAQQQRLAGGRQQPAQTVTAQGTRGSAAKASPASSRTAKAFPTTTRQAINRPRQASMPAEDLAAIEAERTDLDLELPP